MKQFFLGTFILVSVHTAAQKGNMYQMTSAGLSAKTIDGGVNELTYYVLHFEADSVSLCTFTITTEQKKDQYLGTLTHYDQQHFKWQKKGDRLLIAGLPPSYTAWAALRIHAGMLTSIKNKDIAFEQLKQPIPASAIDGKSYAADIGNGSYLVFSFDKDSVEKAYMKNIDPKGILLARDEDRKSEMCRWVGYGTHILIPEYGQFLVADFETQQLQMLYNGKYIYLKQETL